MTIEDAIEHAQEISQKSCGECATDHGQLAHWLTELKWFRDIFGDTDFSRMMEPPKDNGQVFQVVITFPDGSLKTVLLKNAKILEDPPQAIEMSTGIPQCNDARSFVLTGTIVEARQ